MDNIIAKEKMPDFLKTLLAIEMWERFSYYGMRSLLVLFLTSHLGWHDKDAYAIYSLFAAIGYAGPSIAGIIADKLLGFRNMVKLGAMIMILGHFTLAFIDLNGKLLYLGLALIAIGTGFFKGNAVNLLGACYGTKDSYKGFNLFYVSIQVGSFAASIICGYIANIYGWHFGFAAAGVGMALGLITFLKFEYTLQNYGLMPETKFKNKTYYGLSPLVLTFLMGLIISAIFAFFLQQPNELTKAITYLMLFIFAVFGYIVLTSAPQQRKELLALSILIIFLMCFFGIEMQLGSLINLFVSRNVDKEILGYNIPASVFQALNPCYIIIMGMIINYLPNANKYTLTKFAIGVSTIALCFAVLYLGLEFADSQGQMPVLFLFVGIAFMSLGELLIGPSINQQTVRLAPKHLKGFVMGIMMMSLSFSNLAGIEIAKFMSVPSIDGTIDSLMSLEIYKAGFFKIIMVNIGFFVAFLMCIPFLRKVIK
jgi:POT family proton-dependent oligopeptide transporter